MQDIGLLMGVTAIFVFGWFVMKGLDVFFARNLQEMESNAPDGERVLRIAFSDPMAAGAVTQALELMGKAHPDLGVCLYTADAADLLAGLRDGQLDAVVVPREAADKATGEWGAADVFITPSAVVIENTALPLCPLKTECILQRLVWTKGGCNGAASDFAAQFMKHSQRNSGNVREKKV